MAKELPFTGKVPMRNLRLCISHQPRPIMPRHLYDELILTTECPGYDTLAGSAAVPAVIETCRGADSVTLMTHRRVTARYGGTAHMAPAALAALPAENFAPRPGHEFLVFVLLCPNGVAAQFAECYPDGVYDWREYTALAGDMGAPVIDGSVLIPGGVQLGVYPGDVVTDILTKVHAVNVEYAARHGERIKNTRSISFLAERLESCLLNQELALRYPAARFPVEILGAPILCSEFAVR